MRANPDALTTVSAARSLAKTVHVHDDIVTRTDDPWWSKLVRFATVETLNPLALLGELTRAADQDPAPCIVRGDPLAATGRRAIYDDAKDGPAGLRIMPRRWVGYDFERVPADGIDPLHEPERAVARVRQCLPPEHHDCSVVWQITASAGKRPDELRLRLWYLLERPMLGRQLAAWCRSGTATGWLDPCTLRNEALPHFVAVKVIGNGPDPCLRRWGLIWGTSDRVLVPDSALALPPEREPLNVAGGDPAELLERYGSSLNARRRAAVAEMKAEIEAVRGAAVGSRHPAYLRAAARIKGLCDFWAIPLEHPRELLEEAYLSTLSADEARRRARGSITGVWNWLDRRVPR